jgi:predicted Fe-Mo cluster-binding NifX family protein
MKITFALALNEENNFEKKHFGKSDKFAIYTSTNNKISFTNEKPEKVLEILNKHMGWFKDELINRNENHMLFQIKNGIIKMHV